MTIGTDVLLNIHNHLSIRNDAVRRRGELGYRNGLLSRTGTAGFLLRLQESFFQPGYHSLCGPKLFAVLLEAGNPGVDKFVAK